MSNKGFESDVRVKSLLSRQPKITEEEKKESGASLSAQRSALHQITSRGGNRSSPPVSDAVLHLQRQFGNHHVQRVLSLVRETDDPSTTVERAIEHERGGGQSLDTGVKQQMEASIGANFSDVRIHQDANADALNRSLSARAFATGKDVFFREGAYNPGSSGGRELLAHELTHVVQQTGSGIHRKMAVSEPGDPQEREAEQVAKAVMQAEAEPDSQPEAEKKKEEFHGL